MEDNYFDLVNYVSLSVLVEHHLEDTLADSRRLIMKECNK
jgi:hypothetical protein